MVKRDGRRFKPPFAKVGIFVYDVVPIAKRFQEVL